MATETVEETVEKLEIPVRFAARKATELRLVLTERHPIYDNNGQRLGQTPGVTAEFRNGLVASWQEELVNYGIPHTKGCNLELTLANPVKVGKAGRFTEYSRVG